MVDPKNDYSAGLKEHFQFIEADMRGTNTTWTVISVLLREWDGKPAWKTNANTSPACTCIKYS